MQGSRILGGDLVGQERGEVQVLSGPGFDTIPTGVGQSDLSAVALRVDSARWGSQLKAAGVNMNLAPVVDLVGIESQAESNPPIREFQRAQVIMVSTATYDRIDSSSPAVFSSTVVTGQLRQTLEFDGVIITDDLSGAKQVEYLTPSNRAIDAIEAGVNIVLVSNHPTVAPGMISVTPYPRAGAPSGVALRLTSAADTDGMFRNLS